MTIASVITLGYGNFAGVQYIPTLGYLPSNAPVPSPTPTTGSGDDIRRARYLEWLKKKRPKQKPKTTTPTKQATQPIIIHPAATAYPPETETLIRAIQHNIDQIEYEGHLQKRLINAWASRARHEVFVALERELASIREEDDEDAILLLS